MKKRYGWIPDRQDSRDLHYKVRKLLPLATTSNRTKYMMPGIFNQLELSSCTGNGIAAVAGFLILNDHVQKKVSNCLPFSRLFVYYNERVIEGSVSEDAGAEIRDGIKTLAKQGVCSEKTWPYKVEKFTKKPTAKAYKSALQFEALQYERLDNTNLQQLVDCLQRGFPFVFGFTVFSGFESDQVAKTGIVEMPKAGEKPLGGHCVWCIDYDLENKGFWCQNSWGEDWGAKGMFFMPQDYMTSAKLANDFWCITLLK